MNIGEKISVIVAIIVIAVAALAFAPPLSLSLGPSGGGGTTSSVITQTTTSSFPYSFPTSITVPTTNTTGNSSVSSSLSLSINISSSSPSSSSSSSTPSSTTTTTSSTTRSTTSTPTLGVITIYAGRLYSQYWAPCFALTCPNGTGPGAWMYFVLYNSSGALIANAYANEDGHNFTGIVKGETYYVYPTDCDNCHNDIAEPHDVTFAHWSNGNTTRPYPVVAGQSVEAWYNYVPINVTSTTTTISTKTTPTTTITTNSTFSTNSSSTNSTRTHSKVAFSPMMANLTYVLGASSIVLIMSMILYPARLLGNSVVYKKKWSIISNPVSRAYPL